MSKMIDLMGTSLSYFKIGKTGPRIKNNAGELEARNTDDSVYANFSVNLLKLFANGAFKTLFRSGTGLASDLEFQFPATKGSSGQVLVGTPDPILNKVVLSFQNPPAGTPTLDNFSLVKQGTGEATYTGGTGTVFSYTGSGNVFALNAASRGGSSFTLASPTEVISVECRFDNAFGNTGTLTAYLVQITGTVLGGTPPVLATSTNSPAFTPGTFPSGTPTPATFNFANIPISAGVEYAILITSTAVIFGSSGTNQAFSTNFLTSNTGTNLQSPGANQNTFYMVITGQTSEYHFITDEPHYIGVRNLPLNYNQIDPFDIQIDDGEVAYVTIDRGAVAPTLRPVTVTPIGTFTPNQDNIIIARKVGTTLYYGIDDQVYIPENTTVDFESVGGGGGGGLTNKAGRVAAGSFSGATLKATVTFATALPNTDYAIVITGVDSRSFTYENKTVNGFDINTNSGVALTGEVSWTVTVDGEA